MKLLNRRARHDYHIFESFEAGIVLTGQEVKSIQQGRGDLSNSFVRLRGGEAWLVGANIPRYGGNSTVQEYDPLRTRKLLLHKKELLDLDLKSKGKSLTFIPLSLYTKGRRVKAQIASARGKKQFEKREAKRRKDLDREAERDIRSDK